MVLIKIYMKCLAKGNSSANGQGSVMNIALCSFPNYHLSTHEIHILNSAGAIPGIME